MGTITVYTIDDICETIGDDDHEFLSWACSILDGMLHETGVKPGESIDDGTIKKWLDAIDAGFEARVDHVLGGPVNDAWYPSARKDVKRDCKSLLGKLVARVTATMDGLPWHPGSGRSLA